MKLYCVTVALISTWLNLGGCGTQSSVTPNSSTAGASARSGDNTDISTWDFGDAPLPRSAHAPQDKDQFAIVVATFTGSGHHSAAQATLSSLSMKYPTLGPSLRARERSRGSVVTYGNYSGYDDSSAKQDLDMLRTVVNANGSTPFGQVMLSKFKSPKARQQLHPHDLWTVRREYPTIVPIYTLEVAIWGDFESGQLPKERRRVAAEQYAAELRKKGFEAYFFHNDDIDLSSVTVGLFSYKAIDPETGFYSLEVEAMMSRFPSRLTNGQPILQYYDPNNPSQGSMEQKPCLAEVPVD